MTQQEVYDILKKKKKWMTSREISKISGVTTGNISLALRKLAKRGEVLIKGSGRKSWLGYLGKPYLYKVK